MTPERLLGVILLAGSALAYAGLVVCRVQEIRRKYRRRARIYPFPTDHMRKDVP